jgi:hypothetical protein
MREGIYSRGSATEKSLLKEDKGVRSKAPVKAGKE